MRIRSFCGLNMDCFDRLLSMDFYACIGFGIFISLYGELRRFFIEVLLFLVILQHLPTAIAAARELSGMGGLHGV